MSKRIGYKKALDEYDRTVIVELEIRGKVGGCQQDSHWWDYEGSLRNKSRTNKAKVLAIHRLSTYWAREYFARRRRLDMPVKQAYSAYSKRRRVFIYRVGRIVRPTNLRRFNPNNNNCGIGVHFFWRLRDAINY